MDNLTAQNKSFLTTHSVSSFETILENKLGDRFRVYRESYKRTMNYQTDTYIPDFPLTVSLELVNRCNLRCVMCWTENHKGTRSRIDMDLIDKVLDECKTNRVPAMVVGMGSESLIDKRTKEVLKKVKEAGVIDIFFSTNGILMDEEISRFLVDEEISRIEISLDAATPETYQEVRGKNELKRIESNIEILIQMKKESGTGLPVLRLSFCEQKINKHEKEQFLQKWDGKPDYIDVQNVQDFSYVDELLKTGNTNAFENLHEDDLPYVYCNYPFNSLHVWANGDITPCCTFYGKGLVFGNVQENTLEEVWHGKKLEQLRKELVEKKGLNPSCKACFASRDPKYFTGKLAP